MNDGGSSGQDFGSGDGVASEAQDKAQEVAGQVQDKAQEATDKARGMLREQIDQRSSEAAEKVSGTAQDLRSVSDELRNQGKDTPARLADRAAERTEQIGSYLSRSDSDQLLADIEDFGRRQPLAILAGGVVVGMAAARFLKASSRNRYRRRAPSEIPTRDQSSEAGGRVGQVQPRPIGAPVGDPAPATVGADPTLGR